MIKYTQIAKIDNERMQAQNWCFCGNATRAPLKQVVRSECSTYCGGDNSEICGSAARMNLFQKY